MKKNTALFIFVTVLVLVYISVFIIPESMSKFALIPEKIPQESWRFLTYPLAHLDAGHLIKNLIGLFIVTAIIFELRTEFAHFSSNYLLSSFLAIIPLWLALQFTALGASTAIYGTLGLISLEVAKIHIKTFYVIAALIAILAFESAALFASGQSTGFILTQASAHLSGLLFGIAFFFYLNKTKGLLLHRKSFILRRLK